MGFVPSGTSTFAIDGDGTTEDCDEQYYAAGARGESFRASAVATAQHAEIFRIGGGRRWVEVGIRVDREG